MSRVCASYRVDFASGAWREVGRLSQTAFSDLRGALRTVAENAAKASSYAGDPLERGEVAVGELKALYEIDHRNACVMVLDVHSKRAARNKVS